MEATSEFELFAVCIFQLYVCWQTTPLLLLVRSTFSFQLVAQQCCIASWDCLLPVLPPPLATNFHVAESRRCFYFLQHENLLRAWVVIRATMLFNLQCNIVARQVERKMLPVLLGLQFSFILSTFFSSDFLGRGTPEFLVGLCSSIPQTLTSIETKVCHFPVPF